MSEPKLHVVKPFGLIGGDYEVDGAGRLKYLLACALAALVAGLFLFRDMIGLPLWADIALPVAGLAVIAALCVDVVRKGRKL
jgi:hypothetical protein